MSNEDSASRFWLSHKMQHNLLFSNNEEDERRLMNFRKNNAVVEKVNSTRDATFSCAHNRMSHWDHDEYVGWLNSQTGDLQQAQKSTKKKPLYNISKKKYLLKASKFSKLPTSEAVDWCSAGVVSSVKDQGNCGSCWAFAGIGAIESGYSIKYKNKEPTDLSVQQILDCNFKNYGSDGGFPHAAYEYAMKCGITTETNYPYEAKKGVCRYDGKNGVKVKSQRFHFKHEDDSVNEELMVLAVANVGPLAVGIDASFPEFMLYSSGVYFNLENLSKSFQINHAVLLVGYGVNEKGTRYYKIKNSWGPLWGDKGYALIERTDDGYLGMGYYYSYPKL